MSINKLNIVNGIIQDKFIDGIPVIIKIIQPSGLRNVRTLEKLEKRANLTAHNTGNSSPTATDEAHAKWLQTVEIFDKEYVSVPIFIDQDSITQTIPLDEICYHCGNKEGNRTSIGFEICENADILKAEDNAKKFCAAMLLTYPDLTLRTHQSWSGKFCPHIILSRVNGWEQFVIDVNAYVKGSTPSVEPVLPSGDTVNISGVLYGYKTASDALNDKNRAATIPNGNYPVMIKHKSGAWNIGKGYLYWIDPKKIGINSPVSAPPSPPSQEPTPSSPSTIIKGSKVKVKTGSKSYDGVKVASFIYSKVYTVDELKADRAVLDVRGICTAFKVSDLILQ